MRHSSPGSYKVRQYGNAPADAILLILLQLLPTAGTPATLCRRHHHSCCCCYCCYCRYCRLRCRCPVTVTVLCCCCHCRRSVHRGPLFCAAAPRHHAAAALLPALGEAPLARPPQSEHQPAGPGAGRAARARPTLDRRPLPLPVHRGAPRLQVQRYLLRAHGPDLRARLWV